MPYNFYPSHRKQLMLMPPSLEEWLPEDDLARLVLEAVEEMDLRELYERYREDGTGHAAYEPRMMLATLLYGYCVGERSSRKIEKLCERDIAFRYLTENQKPDHSTLARFRKEHEKGIERVFIEVLKLCREAGLVKVGLISVDGTKIQAVASLAGNRTLEGIESEVKKILKEAEERDEQEDQRYGKAKRGDEMPEGMKTKEARLKRLLECKARLEAKAKEEEKEQAEKIAQREKEEEERGEKKRGRKPKDPEDAVNKEAKANMVDPESRIMKGQQGYVQGYNAQIGVTKDQIIVAAEVTQEENDMKQTKPMMGLVKQTLAEAGVTQKVRVGLLDAGYEGKENLEWALKEDTLYLIATKKSWKLRKAMKDEPYPRGRMQEGLSPQEKMTRRLLSKAGRRLYKLRGQTVEPVFGQMKEGQGFRRFSRRGVVAARSEFKFQSAAHNLMKLWRSNRWRKKRAGVEAESRK